MYVIHAHWPPTAAPCLWAEDSTAPDPYANAGRTATRPRAHPFAAPPSAYAETLGIMTREPAELVVRLPTVARMPLPSPELVRPIAGSPPGRQAAPRLQAWRIVGLRIPDSVRFGELLWLSKTHEDLAPGGALRWFADVEEFADDLIGRGRVVPGIRGKTARWLPVLSGPDAAAMRSLADAMPPLCRAAEPEGAPPVAVRALDGLVDALVRQRIGHLRLGPVVARNRVSVAERWMRALTSPDGRIDLRPADDIGGLSDDLAAWQDALQGRAGPVRACFRLTEPTEDDLAAWRVEFLLQARDDPSLLVPAQTVWSARTKALTTSYGVIADPQEALLTDLGRACRLYPAIEAELRTRQPSAVTLDGDGAQRFLREAAPLLLEAGFGVLLPSWWSSRNRRVGLKLSAHTTKTDTAVTTAGLGMSSLVDFRWELAVGDDTLSEAELTELTRNKAALVRIRGQWVEVDQGELARALEFVAERGNGQASAGEILAAAVNPQEAAEGLNVSGVSADGWLGALLDGELDASVEPISPSANFAGTLRPYQERGLTWLHHLSQLGVGACLADDMGLGKCVAPETLVFVNGTVVRADDIWAGFAGAPAFDGEGFWATPTTPLVTNAIDSSGRIVVAPIQRVYRQRVVEPLRRIQLDDGSVVVVTKRHRLLTIDGWTTCIQPGDRVCVPSHLVWRGEPVDEDLAILVAWQLAEGNEEQPGRLMITQKNRATLERIRDCARRYADRNALKLNSMPIRLASRRSVHDLRINSVAYTKHVERLGYQWGHRSAAKRIPDFLVSADDRTIRVFLREYFTAAAAVNPGMRLVEISSASAVLMQQIGHMLRRLGIWMRMTAKEKWATNGAGIHRTYHFGLIGGPSLRTFRDLVGFSENRKQSLLAEICSRRSNTNVEGIPGYDLLTAARRTTKLPMRHLGAGTVYFDGSQEMSRSTAGAAIAAMDRVISGEAHSEYAAARQSKRTAKVLTAYTELDTTRLQEVRSRLAQRLSKDVHYAHVVSVTEIHHDGWVYDFEVAGPHNFVAGGVLCHNTVQALALLGLDDLPGQLKGLTLLVCPMSVVGNWQREAARFAPKLRVHVHHGGDRLDGERLRQAAANADLVITTYPLVARDAQRLAAIAWHRVVLDEAQNIKNSQARQTQAIRTLPATHRLALTGTPVENRLSELWSIMEFLNPGLLGPASRFRERFAIPIERHHDEDAALRLKRATQPFILRRVKTDKSIIDDLPDKVEMKVLCNLTPEQASLYQAVVDDMLGKIDDSEGMERRGLVLATMVKLKQACNHPAQLLHDGSRLPGRSGKLARLEEIAEEVLADGDKALVFTQFAEFGAMLQPYLTGRLQIPVHYLHGGTSRKQRDALVEQFQASTDPAVFVLSLKAGGTGLNLTAANHVIHFDRWWNPAVEDQATDRAFRIGQRKDVQVRKFVCVGTLEERIDAMIDEKKALAEMVVGAGETWLTELTTDELRALVALDPDAAAE